MFTLARGLGLSSCHHDWLIRDLVAGLVLATLVFAEPTART